MLLRKSSSLTAIFILALATSGFIATSAITSANADTTQPSEMITSDFADEQNAFSSFLGDAMNTFPDEIVDYSWDRSGGTVLVQPNSVAAVQELAASMDSKVTVEPSIPQALPMRDRSIREMAAINLFADVDYQSIGARYDPTTGSVIVTFWSENPVSIESQIDQALRAADPQLSQSVHPEFITSGDLPQTDSNTRGGMYYTPNCTGGFIGNRLRDHHRGTLQDQAELVRWR